jgi:hypothetical protein
VLKPEGTDVLQSRCDRAALIWFCRQVVLAALEFSEKRAKKTKSRRIDGSIRQRREAILITCLVESRVFRDGPESIDKVMK